jgi:pilus assembly protein Flp/PilA
VRIPFNEIGRRTAKILAALWTETGGQDFIEYALLTGFIAVTAGAIMPGVVNDISTIFSKVKSILEAAQTVAS